ncbi:MAG TPA: hypothetical protein VLS90_09130, partial [Thermodesulfobacteriota bacterium]|nr:hypothetical protein [Thermodesulfobacteriota bacterium]
IASVASDRVRNLFSLSRSAFSAAPALACAASRVSIFRRVWASSRTKSSLVLAGGSGLFFNLLLEVLFDAVME